MTFETIPSTLVPFFYVEVDGTGAAGGTTEVPTILMGPMGANATATADVPLLVSSLSGVEKVCTPGSMISEMARAYFANDATPNRVYIVPQANASGTAATGTIVVTVGPSAAGTVHMYIDDHYCPFTVTSSMSVTAVAAELVEQFGETEEDAIEYGSRVPVIATASSGTATLTARNKGALGGTASQEAIGIRFNLLPGQAFPEGMTVTVSPIGSVVAGAGTYSVSNALAAITAIRGNIVHPYADAVNLALLKIEFAMTADGRWGPIRKQYCQTMTAYCGNDYSALATASTTVLQNDKTASVFMNTLCSTTGAHGALVSSPWRTAGAYGGALIQTLRQDPARPAQTLKLKGILGDPSESTWLSWTERNVLVSEGITIPSHTFSTEVGIGREVTTYIQNDAGAADDAYQSPQTLACLQKINIDLENMFTSKYPRVKLVSDDRKLAAGQAVMSPLVAKADIARLARTWETDGIIEKADTFIKLLVVEIDSLDPNRLNVLASPDLVNQLRVVAVKNRFFINYV